MQLLRGSRQLLGERRDFIGFSLHRGNRRCDFLEHAVETLLQEAELVGLCRRGTDREESLLRFSHHAACPSDALDERRRNPLERDRKSTRLNSSHLVISYAVFCLKKNN